MVAKYPAKMFIYYVPYIHTYIHGHETICNKIEDQRFADLFQINKCIYPYIYIYLYLGPAVFLHVIILHNIIDT